MNNRLVLPTAALTATLLLTSCGTDDGSSPGSSAGSSAGQDSTSGSDTGTAALSVVASFYPLQYVTERIAGDAADVASLTKPGAEPHDLELAPQDVATVGDADLVIYLSGFQPAVDEAVDQEATDSSLDVAPTAHLDLTFTPIEGGDDHGHEEGDEHSDEEGDDHAHEEGDEHSDEEADDHAHEEGDDHSHESGVDPHFWLDPTRLADVAEAIATRLGEIDPDNAETFTDNAASLRSDLEELDAEFEESLATCANKQLVTSHNAFGYLAERYGLEQVGISGLTPEDEPSPQDLAAVTAFVEENGVTTIYYETLVSPAIAEVVASETGAETAVLDPLEGLNDDSEGADYLEVMRANLDNLKAGQSCT